MMRPERASSFTFATLAHKEQSISYHRRRDPFYQSNFRAEDGIRRTTPWNDLCDEVLLPLGSLFVVFLAFGIVIWFS